MATTKIFNKRQINEFCEKVNSDIIYQIEDPTILEKIGEDIFKVEEGVWGRRALSLSQVLETYDERGEMYELASLSANECGYKLSKEEEISLQNGQSYEVKRKLIKMLGLREYVTNEEIIETITNLLN